MVDKSQWLAETDSISGLPNMLAAMQEYKVMIGFHTDSIHGFSLPLIDGDDLSKFNKIGYLARDEMIADLGKVMSDIQRPDDFKARWRSGDDFLILLKETPMGLATSIGDRLRQAVIEASQDWTYPITISIGVTGYPTHGQDISELINHAELALHQAKELEKNGSALSREASAALQLRTRLLSSAQVRIRT